MKLLLLKENLKRALDIVRAAVGPSSLPVLKNVLIKASENSVALSATNLELAVTTKVSAKVSEAGAVTVPFQVFSSLVNALSSEKIRVETKGGAVTVTTDNYEATLQTIGEKEFPIIPTRELEKETASLEIDGSFLRAALEQVMIAAATGSDLRPELAGVLFRYSGSDLRLAATDSFRLAEKTISSGQFKNSTEKPFSAIVPIKNVQEIVRIIPAGAVQLYFDENQLIVRSEESEIVSRLVSGKFPEYDPIIPKTFAAELRVHAEELMEGLKLSNVFSSRLHDVRLKSHGNRKAVELFSQEAGIGENTYLVPVKMDGSPFEVIFNIMYFADGIRAILKGAKSDKLFAGVNEEKKPSLFRCEDDASCVYILMPIKRT